MLHHIAIVGSGPSGLFCADALIRQKPDLKIDVFDRLPTPYGLVRFGVAPDHQGTKAVTRQFDRLFAGGNVRFLGNVQIGRDLPLADLRNHYDAVVLALGAHADRPMGVPGEDLPGCYGSMAFVGWYNGHPDFRELEPLLDRPAVAVIGMGNVAVDILRVLGKSKAEMASSDLTAHAAAVINAAPLTDLYALGRRGPIEASFTSAELAEIGRLERVRPVVNKADLPESLPPGIDAAELKVKEKNLQLLHEFADRTDDKPIKLHFMFNARAETVLGDSRVEGLKLAGRDTPLQIGTLIRAIGYYTAADGDLPQSDARGVIANENGRVEHGLYVVGWAKRGPSGTIPTNRADSKAVADLLVADFAEDATPPKEGSAALDTWLTSRGVKVMDWACWKRIEAAEIAGATPGSPRAKLAAWAELHKAGLV